LNRVRGDAALAERLIAYEQRLAPQGERRDWIINAMNRLERHNR